MELRVDVNKTKTEGCATITENLLRSIMLCVKKLIIPKNVRFDTAYTYLLLNFSSNLSKKFISFFLQLPDTKTLNHNIFLSRVYGRESHLLYLNTTPAYICIEPVD